MELLEKTLKTIQEPNREIEKQARARLADQAKPRGSLGRLEDLSVRLAGIAGTLDVRLTNKVIVVCAGDHGVTEEGVSLYPSEVTPQMVYNFVNGGASVSVLARQAGAEVRAADIGVNHEFESDLPIFHKKVKPGTDSMARGPAMSREDAVRSLEAGIEIVEELVKEKTVDLLGTGDMGIGSTTPSAAIIAVLAGLSPEEVTGRGAGLDDSGLKKKIEVIRKSLDLNQPDPKDPIDILAKVGGLEIGALGGLLLGAGAHGIPVICDGLISTAGALIACELAPRAGAYLFSSHRSVEQGHRYMQERLGIPPLLDLGLRLGEGTGAALAMPILDTATRILPEILTFSEAGVTDVDQ